MKIAALVSGGVDSSVVVHQLKEAGYDPTIFYIKIGMEDKDGYIDCPSEEDIEITQYIAKKYGCKMEVVSLHEEYWDNVVSYTIDAVKRGLTPNPDMMCNKLIKFGTFEQKWGHEFDKIATGHYATTTEINSKIYLSTAVDKIKD
ncbi:MAG: tRNA 2-thiouridine(34) synthase MnmA, partial [Bacteroidales bacterium]|nr:tRNA 2-thiouridine(34) synthase MnmA [Bacteroidales bacterium]